MAELVDATDLKSVDNYCREGSSPSIPNFRKTELKLTILMFYLVF